MPDGLGATLTQPMFRRGAIIGIGLIGSSLLRVMRRKGLAQRLAAYDEAAAVRLRARELGVADDVTDTLADAVSGADLVILCTPVGAMAGIAAAMAAHLEASAIVSDVGSVKASIAVTLEELLPATVHIIPAHPVAGTEQSGPDAGFATLFRNRWTILTPPEGADAKAIARLSAFWEHAGAHVERMTPAHHDLVLAITSHVPHLIAYNIVGTAADLEEITRSEVIKFSAGGFRDFTRIAASDPVMWRDIFLMNKDAVLEMLGRFNEDLTALQRMIRRGDADGLQDLFTRTRAIRRGIVDLGQETAAPDFGRERAPE